MCVCVFKSQSPLLIIPSLVRHTNYRMHDWVDNLENFFFFLLLFLFFIIHTLFSLKVLCSPPPYTLMRMVLKSHHLLIIGALLDLVVRMPGAFIVLLLEPVMLLSEPEFWGSKFHKIMLFCFHKKKQQQKNKTD